MRLRLGMLGCVVVLGFAGFRWGHAPVFMAGPYEEEMECRSCNSLYLFRVKDLRPGGPSEPPTRRRVTGDEYDVPSPTEQLRASLFRIGDGTEELIWETYLPYPPRNCYVSNDGNHVVTVESRYWGRAGDRGMQIFGPDGSLIQAYPRSYFDRVVDDPECMPGGRTITGPDSWHLHQYSGFTRDQKRFIVTLMEDEGIMYWNPKTGASLPQPPWPLSDRLMVFDLETGKRVRGSGDDDPIFVHGMIAVWSDLLRSDDPEERLEGARGLAHHLGSFHGARVSFGVAGGWEKHALPILMGCLDDPDLRVRSEVLRAIHRIDSGKARDLVYEFARSEEAELRAAAAELLMEPFSREGFSLLAALLQDPDPATVEVARRRFWKRTFKASPNNNSGIGLLRDCLTEHGYPIDKSQRNIQLLIDVANTAGCAGTSIEEASAIRKAARDLARKIGVLHSQ